MEKHLMCLCNGFLNKYVCHYGVKISKQTIIITIIRSRRSTKLYAFFKWCVLRMDMINKIRSNFHEISYFLVNSSYFSLQIQQLQSSYSKPIPFCSQLKTTGWYSPLPPYPTNFLTKSHIKHITKISYLVWNFLMSWT